MFWLKNLTKCYALGDAPAVNSAQAVGFYSKKCIGTCHIRQTLFACPGSGIESPRRYDQP